MMCVVGGSESRAGGARKGGVMWRRGPSPASTQAQQARGHVTFLNLSDVAGAGIEPPEVSLSAEVFLSE